MSEVTAVPLRPIAKGSLVKLWVGVAAVIAIAIAFAYCTIASQVTMAMTPEDFLAYNAKKGGVVQLPSGLEYKILKEASGPKPGPSDMVLVNYEGKLLSGKVFDSTKAEGKETPRPFPVSGVIPGWTEGMQLMNKGSRYRFWIPPGLAYGQYGDRTGTIPPNAILAFDVELLEIAPAQMGVGGMPTGHGGM